MLACNELMPVKYWYSFTFMHTCSYVLPSAGLYKDKQQPINMCECACINSKQLASYLTWRSLLYAYSHIWECICYTCFMQICMAKLFSCSYVASQLLYLSSHIMQRWFQIIPDNSWDSWKLCPNTMNIADNLIARGNPMISICLPLHIHVHYNIEYTCMHVVIPILLVNLS